jgi:hypothetical protein
MVPMVAYNGITKYPTLLPKSSTLTTKTEMVAISGTIPKKLKTSEPIGSIPTGPPSRWGIFRSEKLSVRIQDRFLL